MKRVASFAPTEKPCQLMIAPGLLVMLSVLPCCAMTTPLATLAPIGLAYTGLAMTKQDATATAATLHCQVLQWWVFFILTPAFFRLTGMANMPPLIMKPAIPVPPTPTFPRKQGKEQMNRCASFTLTRGKLRLFTGRFNPLSRTS